MEITGRIIEVLPLQSGVSSRGEWKKQDYVIEYNYDQQYPKKMSFNVWGDNVDRFNIQKGQELTVSFDIDCREYQGRWYNDIRAWRVTQPQVNSQMPPQPMQEPNFGPALGATPSPMASMPADSIGDMPF